MIGHIAGASSARRSVSGKGREGELALPSARLDVSGADAGDADYSAYSAPRTPRSACAAEVSTSSPSHPLPTPFTVATPASMSSLSNLGRSTAAFIDGVIALLSFPQPDTDRQAEHAPAM
jgi:hypothetical protein